MSIIWDADYLNNFGLDEIWDDNVDFETAIIQLNNFAKKQDAILNINPHEYFIERLQDGSQLSPYQAQFLIDNGIWKEVSPVEALKMCIENIKDLTSNEYVYGNKTSIKISDLDALICRLDSEGTVNNDCDFTKSVNCISKQLSIDIEERVANKSKINQELYNNYIYLNNKVVKVSISEKDIVKTEEELPPVLSEKNEELKIILEKRPAALTVGMNNRIFIGRRTHLGLVQTKDKSVLYFAEPNYIEIAMPQKKYSSEEDYKQLIEDLKSVL
ncbi:MAG: hypothetical protein PHQ17_08825 [Methanobacterium sp.]|nr:hypothetical protein [Methanobacterium sp.]